MIWLLCSYLFAHPFSTDEYSLRTSMKVSPQKVSMLVALEVPIPTALKDIGAKKEESTNVKKKKIERYTKKQWALMSKGLSLSIDGVQQKGKWLPIDDPSNGKAAEGFFVYLVTFVPKKPPKLQDGSRIVLQNSTYETEKMVYSASVYDSDKWNISSSTAQEVLGENQFLPITDEARWTRDDRLRTLEVVISSK